MFLCQDLKKGKKGTLARQTFGGTDIKHGMHTQLDFGSYMGVIPPGYIFPLVCKTKTAHTKKKKF